ncbi:quinol dehydrogenase periplasmic component domain protein, partial [Vibrio parahaemolyticus V-223/04]
MAKNLAQNAGKE